MRTFARKPNLAPPKAAAMPNHGTGPIVQSRRAIDNPAMQQLNGAELPRRWHDFSQIPLHPPMARVVHTNFAINRPKGEQGRPVDLDPSDPRAESGRPPEGESAKAPSDAAKKEKKCCGCIEDIKISHIRKINEGRSYGHSFKTAWSLRYVETEGAANDLALEWWEKTNRGYTAAMRAANDVWYDMTKDPDTADSFAESWGSRAKPCPGKETITDTDPPTASLDLPARTLEFKITVNSGADCKCKHASKTVTAKQVLEPTDDTPPKVKTQTFTTS